MDNEDQIKIRKLDNVVRIKGKEKIVGSLHLFATHFIFMDSKGEELWVQLTKIGSIKKRPLGPEGTPLDLTTRDFLFLSFIFPREQECVLFIDSISSLTTISDVRLLSAFKYRPVLDTTSVGHDFCRIEDDFARMGVPNRDWQPCSENQDYTLCSTYPKWLYVPAIMAKNVSIVRGSARFRSRGRLPALTYQYWNKASICRCSQPLSGVQGKRSIEDESLIAAIHRANPNGKQTIIIDTRPKVNAMANRAGGKGYENIEGYPDCTLVFQAIQNIHVMRDSLFAFLEATRLTDLRESVFMSNLDDSNWLKHIRTVMEVSLYVANTVSAGSSVVIHCSDGWDRTAQTCAIAQVLLDPYYRTIKGFLTVIEKDWLGFGHKFVERCGFLERGSREWSPIFLQFLEVTWHISQQFPRAFEFNESFLVSLHDCVQSCEYGTFLGDNERDRYMSRVAEDSVSVWSYIYSRLDDFLNPLYDIGTGEAAHQGQLVPELRPQLYRVWTSMYCRADQDILPKQDFSQAVAFLRSQSESGDSRRRQYLDVIKAKESELLTLQMQLEKAKLLIKQNDVSKVNELLQELLSFEQSTNSAISIPPTIESPSFIDSCRVCNKSFRHLDAKRNCVVCGRLVCIQCSKLLATKTAPKPGAKKLVAKCSPCLALSSSSPSSA